ncbi:50S ribosomal protein L28, chloroplastic [Hordeum vulgare subsp. vulgare]|uniref:50S ribosomal protein L28, chloroplastic n=1 Tax=Hordeum vulgare subsp. vulgare TaxID=112509 RepID=UPI000295D945|nr:50S ribosomal protein L28, chloroplastic [Hordeum vulgare subsp. vulgare]
MASMMCSYSYSYSMPAAARAPVLRSNANAASLGFATSQLAGLSLGLTSTAVSIPTNTKNAIVARRICPFLEKKTNRANKVSFSNHKTKKQQFVNLQYKKLWWEAGKRYVKLRLSTKALKTIEKHGLDAVAKKAGIDLNKK